MAKPNYQFEKRQRELKKQKKKQEKAAQKAAAAAAAAPQPDAAETPQAPAPGSTSS